jgi:hypothetical protein
MRNLSAKIRKLAETVKENGGRAMLVGGCVRDELMQIEPKDFDIEVYGIEPYKLKEILQQFGKVDAVGEAFTVYKIGHYLDVSLPRREKKVARGHKGFIVEGDPNMSFAEAAKRRDFTINAIMKDILTGEIVDIYGGQNDIKLKKIKHIADETFVEDSLRVLRAAQFAARFEFEIDEATIELCKTIDLTDLPKERLWGELEKLLLKSQKPSIGLKYFYELNIANQLFPELTALVGVPQESAWHPEGWSFSTLLSESFTASVTQTLSTNRSLFSFWEFVTGSSTRTTTTPTISGTIDTQSAISPFTNFKATDGTRFDSLHTPSVTSPTVITQPESLVWTFGNLTPLADEVIRVMFKISLNNMRSIVFTAVDDFEIIKGVVLPVAVFVMDMLPTFEFTSKNQLHNQTVNPNSSVFALPTGINISSVVVDARTSSVDDNVFFYFDLSFVGNSKFVHKVKKLLDSNCFNVELGDVYYHTLLVVDEARKLIEDLPYSKRVTVMLAALCHDFGKPSTTKFFDGRWRAHGHDEAGIEPTISFLDKLGIFTLDGFDVREQIIQLVRYHLTPGMFYKNPPGAGAFRRLARKVEPDLLYRVAKADALGRNPDWIPKEKWFNSDAQEWFIEKVRELNVEHKAPEQILLGRHLIKLGLKPSREFGEITKAVYELQLDGKVTNLDEAMVEAKKIIKANSTD